MFAALQTFNWHLFFANLNTSIVPLFLLLFILSLCNMCMPWLYRQEVLYRGLPREKAAHQLLWTQRVISLLMVAAVRLIAEGGAYFLPHLLVAPPKEAHKAGLTDRQTAVLRLLIKGFGNQEIAHRLKIAENTVKQHTHAIYAVLEVTSRTQAIVAAARLGIGSE